MQTPAEALSLEDLERFDIHSSTSGGQRRFCCPLPACNGKTGRTHQSLTVNPQTGAWYCQRCKGAGKLREFREDKPFVPMSRRDRARQDLHRRFALLPPPRPAAVADPEATAKLQGLLAGCVDLAGTPGEAYLQSRGIPLAVAVAAGVRYHPKWYGSPAVVFCLFSTSGQIVAAQGRMIEDGRTPNKMSCGPVGQGVFATAGAWGEVVTIVEAPIDALSLATVGIPALALCGTALRAWLPRRLAWKKVALAFDADGPGDDAARSWEAALTLGTTCSRLRPEGGKDWNEVLLNEGGYLAAPPFSVSRSEPDMTETTEAPRMVDGGKARPAYGWKCDGGWIGPDIETLPTGVCRSCGWANTPLKVEGPESRCCLCWQADQRRNEADKPLRCETFCEADLLRPERFEPGGMISCPSCCARIVEGQARHAQQNVGEVGDRMVASR